MIIAGIKRHLPHLVQLSTLSVNNAIGALLSFILTIYIANSLGPDQFGTYSFILIVASIMSLFTTFATDSTAPVAFASLGNLQEVVNIIYTVRLFMVIVFGVLSAAYLPIDKTIAFGLLALLPASLKMAFIYEVTKRNILYSFVYLAERSLYTSTVWIFLYLDIGSIEVIFALYFIVTCLSILYQKKHNAHLFHSFHLAGIKKIKSVIVDNLPLVMISLSTFAYGGFSRLVLESKLGLAMLGVYSAGWQIITAITIFQGQVTRVWRLRISLALHERDSAALKSNIVSYIMLTTCPVAVLAGLVFMEADIIVSTLFSKQYLMLSEVLPILSFYFLVINLDGLAALFWIAIKKNAEFLMINVFFSICLIIVLYSLPAQYGMVGFATATVAVHGLSTFILLSWVYFKYLAKLRVDS